MKNREFLPYDTFYGKLRSGNLLEAEYTDYFNLLKSALSTEKAVVKLKLSKPPPTGIENYQHLQRIWKQEPMSSFKNFLRWYNNKDVVSTLEARQKLIAFYDDKNIDMLKLSFTLPNLANICLHKSTDAKVYPFTEGDKDLLEKKIEKMLLVVHLSFLHGKLLLKKLLFKNQRTYANLLLGLTPAKYAPTRCVNPRGPVFIRVGIPIQKRVNSYLDKTRPAAFKKSSRLISNEQDQNMKLKASLQQADRRKLTASVLMAFVLIAALCLKPWATFTTFALVKSCVPLSLKKMFNVVARRESSMHWDDTI